MAFFSAGIGESEWIFLVVRSIGLLLWLVPQDIQLYNQQCGVMIETTTFAGLELHRRVMKKCEPLFLALKPVHRLRYPLSVVALGDLPRQTADEDCRAACVFRAALVDLLIKGLAWIQPIAYYARAEAQTTQVTKIEHTIVAVPNALSDGRATGLEKEILYAIASRSWDKVEKDGWLGGPRLHQLVRAYFGEDVPDPQGSVLDTVELEAARLGLCEITQPGGFWGSNRKVAWTGLASGSFAWIRRSPTT